MSELASSIQKQILPKGFERIKGMDIVTHFSPAKEVGGDYYDLLRCICGDKILLNFIRDLLA